MNTILITFSTLSAMQVAMIIGAVSAAIGAGMMYVFSTGTMEGLGRLPEADAIRAMQAINVAVINPLFLTVFMGTGLYLAVLAGIDLTHGESTNPALLMSAMVYVLGVVGVTVGGNVPLNDALAAVDPSSLTPGTWDGYARPWLRWNHARAFAGALASGLLMLAVVSSGGVA